MEPGKWASDSTMANIPAFVSKPRVAKCHSLSLMTKWRTLWGYDGKFAEPYFAETSFVFFICSHIFHRIGNLLQTSCQGRGGGGEGTKGVGIKNLFWYQLTITKRYSISTFFDKWTHNQKLDSQKEISSINKEISTSRQFCPPSLQ